MTLAGDIRDHRARCQPHLATLRMLTRAETGTALPQQVVTDVVRATGAILAEADAAGRQARSAAGSGPGVAALLQVRLNRLSAPAAVKPPDVPDTTGVKPPRRRDGRAGSWPCP